MPDTNRNAANRGNLGQLGALFRMIALGNLLGGQLPQVRRKVNMDALGTNPYNLATLDALDLPNWAKAHKIERATVRAGGVTGELTPVAYGATPATTQIAVGPNGDIVTLAADAITDMDVVYIPERCDVIEATFPVVPGTGVLTIPAMYTARGVVALAEAEVLEGAVTGKKIILVPGAAPATLQARLNVAKTQVLFNVATDIVTRARVVLLVTAAEQLHSVLEAPATLI